MASEESSVSPIESAPSEQQAQAAAPSLEAAPEKLDELEEINFLLEEIESKIAPLALA
ncbi:Xan family putative trans-acting RiPP leader peptide [Archangium violaceum]|uniref:Xan family putative trans-acting RiPP leader peptide n=1 Tax=Archangium violaceum TaxID=83451 RepID=UPI00193BDD6C|nr:Xan family putative trans-acting RiPP leader peptide [Archangium violaceum]QRK08654.1 Xan family putative trans-acting RiPP leader peptide [Archangium violaceum]